MSRSDISNDLIHFTKGESLKVAFDNLCSIISQGLLRGSTDRIKGGFRCVCFSEAPISTLAGGLVNPDYYTRYSPFGIMVPKAWLYDLGGRPVIYQSDAEYAQLPASLKWRHVRYEPTSDSPIDFSWEREWRVCCDELPIDPNIAAVIVKDDGWAQRLIDFHQWDQDFNVYRFSFLLGDEIAEFYREPFRWKIVVLS